MTNPTDYSALLGQEVRGTNGSLTFVGRLVGLSATSVTVEFGATNLTLPVSAVQLELVEGQRFWVPREQTEPATPTATRRRTTKKEA